jgi:hypothetical protein
VLVNHFLIILIICFQKGRAEEEAELWEKFEKKEVRYLIYAEKLEAKAGPNWKKGSDGPPDHMYHLYDQMFDDGGFEYALKMADPFEAGWLALHIRCNSHKRSQDEQVEIRKMLNVSVFMAKISPLN